MSESYQNGTKEYLKILADLKSKINPHMEKIDKWSEKFESCETHEEQMEWINNHYAEAQEVCNEAKRLLKLEQRVLKLARQANLQDVLELFEQLFNNK